MTASESFGRERALPSDCRLEQEVLCELMMWPNVVYPAGIPVAQVRGMIVDPAAFFDQRNRTIYLAICAAGDRLGNDKITEDAVKHELSAGAGSQMMAAGGADYFADVLTKGYKADQLTVQAARLVALHLARQLAVCGERIMNAGFACGADADAALDAAQAMLKALDSLRAPTPPSDMRTAVLDAFAEVDAARKGGQVTVPWGVPWLDHASPIHPGDDDLCVAAARPGVGKTSLVTTGLVGQGLAGIPVGVFAFEMSRNAVIHRMASQLSGVPYGVIKGGMKTNNADFRAWGEAMEQIKDMPIYFECSGPKTARQVISIVRRWHQDHGIRAFWLDHVNDIIGDTKYRERRDAVSDALAVLKEGARDMQVPGIVMAQLNRAGEGRVPDKIHLAETGKLEQIASIVVLLDRPDCDAPPGNKRPYMERDASGNRVPINCEGKIVLRIGKNRNNETPLKALPFNGRLMLIGEPPTIHRREIPDSDIPQPPPTTQPGDF